MVRREIARLWWAPRSAQEITGRHITSLELFYDLVYVVIIAELARSLAENFNLAAFKSFDKNML
ncbi:MAG: low temperature requirement protein A [Candidatus Hermodarchaeota archaeon]